MIYLRGAVCAVSTPELPWSKMSRQWNTPPYAVVNDLEKHVLLDGFRLVIDLEKSKGSRLVDASTRRELLDLYGFYGSLPVGFNHPHFDLPEVQADLLLGAKTKIANSDVYSSFYATFVDVFNRVG